jgi:DNA-directed RNA polymerase specialized sigma24 family protein
LRVVAVETYPDWESIYRHNVDWVHRLLFAKVGNRPDAEDLTTEVFLTALRPLRVSATVPEVRAYLLATARTALAGYWRRTLPVPQRRLRRHRRARPSPAGDATAAAAPDRRPGGRGGRTDLRPPTHRRPHRYAPPSAPTTPRSTNSPAKPASPPET